MRLRESQTGKYDLRMMVEKTNDALRTRQHTTLDVADYFAPLAVADCPTKGKGVMAAADISHGSLVLCEKAFAIGSDEPDRPYYEDLVTKIVRQIRKDPTKAKAVYALYPGPGYDREEPIPDGVLDVARIYAACGMNCFAWGDNELYLPIDGDYFSHFPTASGVALFTSFCNHSCVYNADRLMFGDMILLYACRDIKKGEEITISYDRDTWDNRPSRTVEGRETLRHWFPICDCPLCDAMTKGPNAERVQELLKVAEMPVQSEDDLKEHIRVYNEVRQIYEEFPAKPFLDQFALDIGNEFLERDDWQQAARFYDLAAEGSGRIESRIVAAISGAEMALKMGNRRKAAELLAHGYDVIRLFSGLDFETFAWLYDPLMATYCSLKEQKRRILLQEAMLVWEETHRSADT
jgi:hypothetical protein